jgi:mannose-6-phosphate isomerase-like protein (cupin superfamily)
VTSSIDSRKEHDVKDDRDKTSTPAPRTYAPSEALMREVEAISRKGQRITYTPFAGDHEFKANGLRSYALYRDLGIAAATNGLVQAHVIRMRPPFPEDMKKRHYHGTVFQMMYILKGSTTVQIGDEPPMTMSAGGCWIQPPGVEHAVLGYTPDFEVLEILLPANFDTVNVGE